MTTIRLLAVGDIMLGEDALCIHHGPGTKIKEMGVNFPFLHVGDVLREGDIVIGNLEAVLSNDGINNNHLKTLQMRAVPEAIGGLKYAGFNILSLANNHALEHGQEALSDTLNILAKNNIQYSGITLDMDRVKSREPIIVNVKGITIAFLSYCLVPDKTAYISVNDPEHICSDIIKAKSSSDLVIVSLHWGNEYIQRPSPAQITLAHKIIDSGADLILGHHPHVLQGIEKYHNGIIAYSLGNFVFDFWQEKMRKSMILQCDLSKQGVCNLEIIPVCINDNYQPEILRGERAENLLSEIEMLSSKISIEDLHSLDDSMRKYAVEVAINRNMYRRDVKRYFLTHLHKYPTRFTLQILRGYLKKVLSFGP